MKATWVLSAALAFSGALGITATLLAPAVAQAQQKVGPKVGTPLKAAAGAGGIADARPMPPRSIAGTRAP